MLHSLPRELMNILNIYTTYHCMGIIILFNGKFTVEPPHTAHTLPISSDLGGSILSIDHCMQLHRV